MKKQSLIWITALFVMLGVSACNTMEGMGKDIEAGGDAIKDSAQENKEY